MSGSSRGLTLYNFMHKGDPIPNPIMAGVIREEMLSRTDGKGLSVKVALRNYNHFHKFASKID